MENTMQESEHHKVAKKQQILKKLKESSFSSLKGSAKLMQKIKEQRINKSQQPEPEVLSIVQRQQNIVMQLNNENLQLIEENDRYKKFIELCDERMNEITKKNVDITEQNESLKQQLKIAQVNNAKRTRNLSKLRQI